MSAQFDSVLRLRVEPELNAAIRDRARAEKTSTSEWLRRALRALVKRPVPAATAGQEKPATFDPREVLEPLVPLPFDQDEAVFVEALRAPNTPERFAAYAEFLQTEFGHIHESLVQLEILMMQPLPEVFDQMPRALGYLRQSHQHYQRAAAGVRGLAVYKGLHDGTYERIEERIRVYGEGIADATACLMRKGYDEDTALALALAGAGRAQHDGGAH